MFESDVNTTNAELFLCAIYKKNIPNISRHIMTLAVLVRIKDHLLQYFHSICAMPGCSETKENGEGKTVTQEEN